MHPSRYFCFFVFFFFWGGGGGGGGGFARLVLLDEPKAAGREADLDGDGLGVVTADSTVGTNLRSSGAQTSPRSESDIRINYWNPLKIIAASNNISASGQQAQFYSTTAAPPGARPSCR